MDRNDISKIGANISKYRKMKKYTQKQLGDYLDINSKTISKWENGTVAPDITILNSLANVLGVSVEEILSGVNTTNKKRRLYNLMNFILTILLVTFIMITCYLYFNKWEVYDFSSDHELFYVDGYVITNSKETRYVITNMLYKPKGRDVTKVDSVVAELYSGDELVSVYTNEFEDSLSIEEVMPMIEKSMDGGYIKYFKNDSLFLLINYMVNTKEEPKSYTIDLNFEIAEKES
jgi:transcriptional regulator with XRE-family HTH domain